MGITIGSKNLENTIVDSQQGNIKGSTSKIENKNILLATFLVHTVSNSCSGRFVDDTLDGHTGNGSSIFGCLTLSVVEVSRYGNNSVLYILSEESFSYGAHLGENHSRDFFRGESRASAFNVNLNEWAFVFVDDFER
mmetsp:Transcript_22622/g.26615  ORF Transcript_22622/g.26615 Transcript_22622/m.26615 type:complete len:137 (-) Transcript_22622:393-803(-)